MSPEIFTIYAVRHIASGRYYFGQTRRSAAARWRGHVNTARRGCPGALNEAIREFGADAFVVSPLLGNLNRSQADAWERRMVEQFDARGTLNRMLTQAAREACGARHRGTKARPETRAKMSAAHKRVWGSMSADERRARLSGLGESGCKARRGMRRVKIDGRIQYVAWKPEEDPIEVQRERWRVKAQRARDRRKAQR